jgi:gas vesicle protein
MSQAKKSVARRTFLVGLLTGAGAVAALSSVPKKAAAKRDGVLAQPGAAIQAILYRRTKDVERYYKTLYT